jgi:hydroxypyruvate isomerase
MLKFAANLSMMFTEEKDPVARIRKAAEAGFGAVEYMFIYDLPADRLRREKDRVGVEWSVVNIPVAEGVKYGPAAAATPGHEAAFRENVAVALEYCRALDPAGLVIPAYPPAKGVSRSAALSTFKANLPHAGDALGGVGIPVLIEAFNPAIRAGALLTTTEEVMEIIDALGHPNIRLEYDAYHMHVTEADMAKTVEKYLALIDNVQIADFPGRGEPGTGEIDYQAFLAALERMGFDKWVACEYEPTGPTLETLGWAEKWMAKGRTER